MLGRELLVIPLVQVHADTQARNFTVFPGVFGLGFLSFRSGMVGHEFISIYNFHFEFPCAKCGP